MAPALAAVKNLASRLEAIGVPPRERIDLTLPRLLPRERRLEVLPLLLARLPILDLLPLALLGKKSGLRASKTEDAIRGRRCLTPMEPASTALSSPSAPV